MTLTVTDNQGATNSVSHQVTVSPANVAPTAAFTASTSNLAVSLDGSSSTDPDGTIAGYAWNFGDGATGSGAAGTYTVTLTVTDNQGATGTATKQVTVIAANAAPTAAFTASCTNLSCSFDGSGSADSDGTIVGYAWNFGDNTTGTGSTAAHAYATAGTYTVTLTVTDNQGATDSVSHTVTVSTVTVYAADAFARSVSNGWGAADTGGAWTVTGASASNFTVTPGAGDIKMMVANSGPGAYLNGLSLADSNGVVDFTLDKAATGGGTYVSLAARHTGTSEYRVRTKILATGVVQVSLTKVIAGTETVLVTQTVSGLTFAVGTTLRMRLQVSGTSSVALAGKVWKVGAAEPASWQVTTTDAPSPLGAGAPGVRTYLSGTATNAPVVTSYSNLSVEAIATP